MKRVCGKAESGLKLLSFLKTKFDEYSSSKLKKMIENNSCKLNGRVERHASTLLAEGDEVDFVPEKKQLVSFQEERVLYEDAFFLAYDKPPFITSDERGLLKLFPRYLLVHRLDRETSGVILLAKTKEAYEALTTLFKKRKIKKMYLAIVSGVLRQKKGILESHLRRKKSYEGGALWGSGKGGVYAKTEWILKKAGKEASLLACYPETGRTHQIRVQLKEMGHPILGDYQYERRRSLPFYPKRSLLHAAEISFSHPFTSLPLKITAPLSEDFQEAMERLFS